MSQVALAPPGPGDKSSGMYGNKHRYSAITTGDKIGPRIPAGRLPKHLLGKLNEFPDSTRAESSKPIGRPRVENDPCSSGYWLHETSISQYRDSIVCTGSLAVSQKRVTNGFDWMLFTNWVG